MLGEKHLFLTAVHYSTSVPTNHLMKWRISHENRCILLLTDTNCNNAMSICFKLLFIYSLLFFRATENIVRFSYENIMVSKLVSFFRRRNFYNPHFSRSSFSTLLISCTPHSPHSVFSSPPHFLHSEIFHNSLFPHSTFSILPIFHFSHILNSALFYTPRFPHSSISTLRTFHTLQFLHSISTLLIFHTVHFPHSSFPTLFIFHT